MSLDKSVHSFLCKALNAVNEEVKKLDERERLPATTEILESLFGSHKNHSACGGHGITGNVLTLGALVGKRLTSEGIRKTMEDTPVQSMLGWVSDNVGDTLSKLRNRFFRNLVKGQNLPDSNAEVLAAG